MATYSIGDQAQALFPDGLQESVIISNDGPSTLYLDEFSSISADSYSLPVTATIVWDSQRPLWVKSKDSSKVRVTRNGYLKEDGSDTFATLYHDPNYSDGAAPGIPLPALGNAALEVSSFRTIMLWFSESVPASHSTAERILVSLQWYDENNHILDTETIEGYRSNGGRARVFIPTRGFSVDISATPYSAGTRPINLRVFGLTRALPLVWDSMANEAVASDLSINEDSRRAFFTDRSAATGSTVTRYLNGLSGRLRVSVRHSTTASNPGTVNVLDRLGTIVGQIVIPASSAAGSLHEMTVEVPPTKPLRLTHLIPSGFGNIDLSVSFYDY